MLTIGLTGGIGSGKTAVSDHFSKLNIPVIDTDQITHELLASDALLIRQLTQQFGDDILDRQGRIDRKKLGRLVFGDTLLRQQLEAILHPMIREQVKKRLQKLDNSSPAPYVIIVVPLLLESGFQNLVDRILVVDCDQQTRVERIRKRDQRDLNEIQSIMNSQIPDRQRLNAADDVIDNSNDINHLQNQIETLHNRYLLLSARLD